MTLRITGPLLHSVLTSGLTVLLLFKRRRAPMVMRCLLSLGDCSTLIYRVILGLTLAEHTR